MAKWYKQVQSLWLPVRRRVEFKHVCLVPQALAEQTPAYLASDIQLSADTHRPVVYRQRQCIVTVIVFMHRRNSLTYLNCGVDWIAAPVYVATVLM